MKVTNKPSGILAYIASQATQTPKISEQGIFARVRLATWRIFVSIADWCLSWSSSYRALKERFLEVIDKAKLPSTPKWSTPLKVGLIAAGILVVGVGLYYYSTSATEINPFEIERSLDPACKEAADNYCKSGVCLGDYLSPDWEPFVHTEYDRDILCSVNLQASNCTSLVGQPTVEEWLDNDWSFVFKRNYERIAYELPSGLSEQAKSYLKKFPEFFKSHIFCQDA